MRVGVARESAPGERRVALVPDTAAKLVAAGFEVVVEPGAGDAASFPDEAYRDAGASIGSPWEADALVKVAKPDEAEAARLREGQLLICYLDPLADREGVERLASRGVIAFAMESIPRITRAQSMDALSSQATVGGYKGALLAAEHLPRFFPMLMTAAGTVPPAKVLVIGAGVAGLQAIATAKRLGAVVSAYDVRPAVKEQVQSLGGRFVELPLETTDAQDARGYAKAQDEAFYARQRELLGKVIAENDAVITTAVVPGKKAPVLVTEAMAKGMAPGSVILDLAAERGGNCELTRAGESIVAHGVTIIGPINLAGTAPYHSSQVYARNLTSFLQNLVKDGQVRPAESDDIIRDTLLTQDGEVVNARVREMLGLAAR
jgi:H+-translocating NAD(P) transhydrogenase subunit alpha